VPEPLPAFFGKFPILGHPRVQMLVALVLLSLHFVSPKMQVLVALSFASMDQSAWVLLMVVARAFIKRSCANVDLFARTASACSSAFIKRCAKLDQTARDCPMARALAFIKLDATMDQLAGSSMPKKDLTNAISGITPKRRGHSLLVASSMRGIAPSPPPVKDAS